jgi:rRNA maturation RNase YbeY
MNRDYLEHDYHTDILTFDLAGEGEAVLADIYISVDRVRKNAIRFNCSIKEELHRVIFHGSLHCCGYRDKTPQEILQMRKKEDEYLAIYFKSVPRRTVS